MAVTFFELISELQDFFVAREFGLDKFTKIIQGRKKAQ
jgi:hypothetical protein